MQPPPLRTDWMIATFLLGLLLFNRPLLEIFDAGPMTTVFGIPLLFFYIFVAWGAVIALMAAVIQIPAKGGGPIQRTGPRTGKGGRGHG